jgi:hypothetical protein
MKSLPKILLVGSIASYAASLATPAFYDSRNTEGWLGLAALISGVFGVLGGFYCWLANPLLVVAWILALTKKSPWAICGTAILACLLSSEFMRHDLIYVDEGGSKAKITSLGIGYWLWLISQILMFVHGLFQLLVRGGGKKPNGPNQALRPTPIPVTDRAAACSASATGAADL